jgi:hypothetical protein
MSTLPSLSIRPRHVHRQVCRFTPGPYHVSGSGARVRSLKSAGGRTIAHVLFSVRHESECEATAQLLAAAPDLLLELRSLVVGCPCGQHAQGIDRHRKNATHACSRCASALAVIAKAEGQ